MRRSRYWHRRKAAKLKISERQKMSEKLTVNVPEDIKKRWDEMMLCATLIREGKARIVIAVRKDGSTYRYTKQR